VTLYPDLLKHQDRLAAIADTGVSILYRELYDFSLRIADTVKPHSLVFSFCENTIGSLAGCVAFLNNGVVPLLLDAGQNRQLLDHLLDTYQPEYIYLPSGMCQDFPEFNLCLMEYDYALMQTNYTEKIPLHKDLAMLFTTSGSTGSPKLVRLSIENLRENGKSINEYLGIGPDERPITTLPMHYSYGFSIINSHLLAGATLLLTTKTLVEKDFWTFFRTEKATSFGGVPYTFEMLKKLRFSRMEFPTLKTITQAGGKLSDDLLREFAEYAVNRDIRFFVMYGQTEASPRMSYLPPEYALSKCGSMGDAIPGGEFSLVDGNGTLIDANHQEGELVYRGKNVTMGYAIYREDLAKGDKWGGVLYTGDMALRDQDGLYYITGRKKRFIKLFGNRVNLDEAEQLIKFLTPDCACCGSDDKMVIYITETGKEHEVRQFISSKTAIHHSAFAVKVVPEIPRNKSGKTLYSDLCAR
jgi:long-chain acyl-CoA synthetase